MSNRDYGNIVTSHFSALGRGLVTDQGLCQASSGIPMPEMLENAAQVWSLTLESRVRSPPRRSSNVRALLSASRAFSSAETQKKP